MNIKKGLITTLKAVWWTLMVPPRMVRWVWKHKLISALAAVGVIWGAGKLKTNTSPCPCQPRVVQQAKAQQKIVAPSLADMEKAASAAVEKNALVSSPSADHSSRDGDRALPAMTRIAGFVEKGVKESDYPEKKGLHSIIICDKSNPENYALMHIGFHHDSNQGVGKFKLYHSFFKSNPNKMPLASGTINISFDVPGVRMGIMAENGEMNPTKCDHNAATLQVSKDNGRTLLLVNEKGGVEQITDTKVIDEVFKAVGDQKAPVYGQSFTAYHDAGAYPNEKQQWQKDLEKNFKSSGR